MNKEMWKKIYGQCRMWVNAREITLDPVPYMVCEDGNYSWVHWYVGNIFIAVFIGPGYTKIYLNRPEDNFRDVVIRKNA